MYGKALLIVAGLAMVITGNQPGTATGSGKIPTALPEAKLEAVVGIRYLSPTWKADASTTANDPAPALRLLEVEATGYLADIQKDWVTVARRQETRWDGVTYYCDLFSIPRANIVSVWQETGRTGVTIP